MAGEALAHKWTKSRSVDEPGIRAHLAAAWRELTWQRIAITILLLAVSAAASYYNHSLPRPLTGPLIFLLGISYIGATQGLALGMLSAVAGALIVNYLIDRPAFVLNFDSPRDFIPICAFIVAAGISGSLANRLRNKARQADARAQELAALLEGSRSFATALRPADIAAAIDSFAPRNLGIEVILFVARDGKAEEALGPDKGPASQHLVELAQSLMDGRPHADAPDGWSARSLTHANEVIGAALYRQTTFIRRASLPALDAFFNMVLVAVERCSLLDKLSNARVIEQSEAFKTAILSSISHDIRTPLSAISTSASGLLTYDTEMSDASKAQLLNTIKEQCVRLSRYTEKLLNFGRLQAGIDAGDLPVVDIVDVLGGAVNSIRPHLGSRTIRKALGRGPILVRADPSLIEQVFFNILDNAVIYSPDGSSIEVALALNDNSVSATITDEGQGIPASELESVFDRFYRTKRGKASAGGNGLGLAIAKGFAEVVGGDIRAESPATNGIGTRLIVTIPLAGVE